jgi:cytoplasmic iron level regulating protein YaaA (DUF328/UPF0246 family)
MKLVISPAKSLDLTSKIPTDKYSNASFLEKSQEVAVELKKLSPKDISSLMKISDKLGELNYDRNQSWELPFNSENSRQAVYTFNGDVYKGLDVYSLGADKLEKLQDTVRILSGQYGYLKPLDLIQPYRLEMGTKFSINGTKNLYEFWKTTLTESLNEELDANEVFLNLASNEYFKAIDVKKLKVPIINVDFKELKNGAFKTIGIYAKQARGLMTRFIIDNNIDSIDEVKNFSINNYGLSDELSSENKLVFVR